MSETQAVLAANQAFYQAFEQKNIEAMSAVWSRGAGCICIHPGRPILKGWDQIRQSWDQIFQHTESIQITPEIVSAEVSGNLGCVILVTKLVQMIQGNRVDVQSLATNIFGRVNNSWYLIHHHGSPILPAAPNQGPPPPGMMPRGMPPMPPGMPRRN